MIPMRRGSSGSGRFAVAVEKAFLLQLLFQLFERELESADPFRLDILEDELVFPARLVYADPSPADHLHPVLKRELEKPLGGPEQHGADLALFVLERKIGMSGLGKREIGDFPFDPDIGERSFEQGS